MDQNPYQTPTQYSANDRRPERTGLRLFAMVGSGVLILVGLGIFYLSTTPSDASRQFLLVGCHVFVAGSLGAILTWPIGLSRPHRVLRYVSTIVNGLLVIGIVVLLVKGFVRGPLVGVALFLGVPAIANGLWATFGLRLKTPTETGTEN